MDQVKVRVYQIRTFDGSYRFVVAENDEQVKKDLSGGEKFMGVENLEYLLGGHVKVIIDRKNGK